MFEKQNFSRLLSPLQIRNVTLKNRMVKTSSAMGLASDDGYVTDENCGFYEAQAKGGIGLIIVEHGFVDYPMGVTGPRRISINDDKFVPGLERLVQVIHKYGTPCFQQLGHCGPAQRWLVPPGQRIVAASESGENGPRALSINEIEELIEKYTRAAERAQKAGFDGVEVQAAATYLLASFLSRAWNKRTDSYGCQDMNSRTRFLVEILRAVRLAVGPDFPVGVRINGAEYGIQDGMTSAESQSIAVILEEVGADYIGIQAIGTGPYDLVLFPEQIQYPETPKALTALAKKVRKPGALVPLGDAIKKAVKIPVVAVGRLDAPLGEWILREEKADLIGMTRRLFADPEYPNKIAKGRIRDIAPCTACIECWASQQTGTHIQCRVNATLGREYELAIRPAERKKKILVVGGGPAGMETARVAASRGHEVVLCEKGRGLGGLLPLAAMIKGTEIEDIPALISFLKKQIISLGVEVRLGTEVNVALMEEARPDAVVVASGGTLTVPDIPGITNRKVVSNIVLHRAARNFLRFLTPGMLRWLTRFYLPLGHRVTILNGRMQGCELADFLVKRGRKVTIVEPSDHLGAGLHEFNRKRLIPWLITKGVVIYTNIIWEKIDDSGLHIITKEGEHKIIEADSILVATPPAPNTELFNLLQDRVDELYLVGDSCEPRTIIEAIADGYRIGRLL